MRKSTRDSGNSIKERAKVRGNYRPGTNGTHNCLAYLVACDPRFTVAMLDAVGIRYVSRCTQCGSPFSVPPKETT